MNFSPSQFSVKNIIFLLLVSALLIFGWFFLRPADNSQSLRSVPDHSIVEWQLAGERLQIEVVNTPGSIEQGLGGRRGLETDGMLFVFSEPVQAVFWMKDMLMPIDIVWISNGRVVGIESNIQPSDPETPEAQLQRFRAPQPVDMVLETPVGRLSETH